MNELLIEDYLQQEFKHVAVRSTIREYAKQSKGVREKSKTFVRI